MTLPQWRIWRKRPPFRDEQFGSELGNSFFFALRSSLFALCSLLFVHKLVPSWRSTEGRKGAAITLWKQARRYVEVTLCPAQIIRAFKPQTTRVTLPLFYVGAAHRRLMFNFVFVFFFSEENYQIDWMIPCDYRQLYETLGFFVAQQGFFWDNHTNKYIPGLFLLMYRLWKIRAYIGKDGAKPGRTGREKRNKRDAI